MNVKVELVQTLVFFIIFKKKKNTQTGKESWKYGELNFIPDLQLNYISTRYKHFSLIRTNVKTAHIMFLTATAASFAMIWMWLKLRPE